MKIPHAVSLWRTTWVPGRCGVPREVDAYTLCAYQHIVPRPMNHPNPPFNREGKMTFKTGDLVMFRDIEVLECDLHFLTQPNIYPMYAWLREYVNWDTMHYISGKPLYCIYADSTMLSVYNRPHFLSRENRVDMAYTITCDTVEPMWYPPAICTRRLTVKAE